MNKFITVVLVVATLALAVTFLRDEPEYKQSQTTYNNKVTSCLDRYGVAHVYDFSRMASKTDQEAALLVGLDERSVAECR